MPDSSVEDFLPDLTPIPEAERVRRRGATPCLFISYSHADIGMVHPIAKRLNDEFYYDVWFDYDSIRSGEPWREEIARGIHAADVILFMLSPTAAKSEWCKKEIGYTLSLNAKLDTDKQKRIIPIRINGACGKKELKNVGLEGIQYCDFATMAPDWEHLLKDLPEVMPRNRRWNDKFFRERHARYLRSVFNAHDRANLTAFLDDTQDIKLLDVYVPIKLGMEVKFEVREGQYQGWELCRARTKTSPPKEPPLSVDLPDRVLAIWEDRLREYWADKQARHAAASAADQTVWQAPLLDDHYPYPVESEVAPAFYPYLVITGEPGSGKSTLMKFLALCMAGDQLFEAAETETERRADLDLLGFWPHPAYTPVFIELRDLVEKVFPAPEDSETDPITPQKLKRYIRNHLLKPHDCKDYKDDLYQQMADGDVMFFLDGLDEIPQAETKERRQQIQDLVRLLRDHYSKCRIMITARPYAYLEGWHLDEFEQITLAPLSDNRLHELATKLFQHQLKAEVCEPELTAFQNAIRNIQEDLRNSPLFFTLLVTIWLNNQDKASDERLSFLPGAIYRECVATLIRRWVRKDLKGRPAEDFIGLNEKKLGKLLERLAHAVHTTGATSFTPDAVIVAVYNEFKITGPFDYSLLLRTLAKRTGIIYERAPDEFVFAHETIREYLSACYWARPDHYPKIMLADLGRDPQQWHNVFELFTDEIKQRDQLELFWKAIGQMLPHNLTSWPDDTNDPLWWHIYYAARLLMGKHIPANDPARKGYHELLVDAIVHLMDCNGALPIYQRVELSRQLADLGDPRPGVGVTNHIPVIAWCAVPAGPFQMGGDTNAHNAWVGANFDLAYPFWIAKFPVTYAQYGAFIDAGGYTRQDYWTAKGWMWREAEELTEPLFWQEYQPHGANLPVVGVSWHEAYAFTQWLDDLRQQHRLSLPEEAAANYVVRLPRECEWEKTARHPDGRQYPWGNEYRAGAANIKGEARHRTGSTASSADFYTTAVGLYPLGAHPAHGVHDLIGNVSEWQITEWTSAYSTPDNEDNQVDRAGERSLRGGSWQHSPNTVRAASRSRHYMTWQDRAIGFRVCLSIDLHHSPDQSGA